MWARPNVEEAYLEVKRNKGAAGVDGVTIQAFESKLEDYVLILQQTGFVDKDILCSLMPLHRIAEFYEQSFMDAG